MKKVLFAVAAAMAVLFSSCGGPKTADSMFIYSGWALYSQKDDGSMESAAKVETGDPVKVYVNSKGEYKTTKATLVLSNGKAEEFDFYQVQYDDKDYWTRSCFFAGNLSVTAGYTVKELSTYASDDVLTLKSGKNSKLKTGTPVVVVNSENKDDFIHLKSFNWEPFGADIYVKDGIVTDPASLDAIRFFGRINKDTKKEVFMEVFTNMYRIYDLENRPEVLEFCEQESLQNTVENILGN